MTGEVPAPLPPYETYWPRRLFAQDDAAAAEYFRQTYYLVGMLYAAGLGDEAILALSEAAKKVPGHDA
jgi:hypothetical protein